MATHNPDDTLMRVAPATAKLWLRESVQIIDEMWGAGYAQAHPELLAAMLAASASDYQTNMLVDRLERLTEALGDGLSSLA